MSSENWSKLATIIFENKRKYIFGNNFHLYLASVENIYMVDKIFMKFVY